MYDTQTNDRTERAPVVKTEACKYVAVKKRSKNGAPAESPPPRHSWKRTGCRGVWATVLPKYPETVHKNEKSKHRWASRAHKNPCDAASCCTEPHDAAGWLLPWTCRSLRGPRPPSAGFLNPRNRQTKKQTLPLTRLNRTSHALEPNLSRA